MASIALKLTRDDVRAYWAAHQGLSLKRWATAGDVVRATGWPYSAGSTLPYLTIRARCGCDRAAVDAAVFDDGDLLPVPSVRGCTMLVPREDVPAAIAGGGRWFDRWSKQVRRVCGVTTREIDRLATDVKDLLVDGPLSLETIRAKLPRGHVRDLGDPGRRLGERSTLTVALRFLQQDMAVRRVAADRRLDSESFAYRLWPEGPRKVLSREEADLVLASRFFDWAAPATLDEYVWWAGIGRPEARRIAARLALAQVAVEGWTEEAWMPIKAAAGPATARERPADGSLALLPFRDNFLYFRRGLRVFLDKDARNATVLDSTRRPAIVAELDSLHHHAIVLGGRLIGIWDYDPDTETVIWRTFGRPTTPTRDLIESTVENLRRFIHTTLGDVAFYPFDRGRTRRERVESIRRPPGQPGSATTLAM